MNINDVLSFTRTADETSILVSKVRRQLWASNAPYWYVPYERISILERYGLSRELGRYILFGEIVLFDKVVKPNLSQLLKPEYYPVELSRTTGPRTDLVYFNGGDYRAQSRYFNFITNGADNVSCLLNPKRQRILIHNGNETLGVMIAGAREVKFSVDKCTVCGNAGSYMLYNGTYKYSVCGEEHEKEAVQKIQAAQFVDSINQELWRN